MIKPFFGYFGGKYRAAKLYPAPRYDSVVEPFAGAAGYALRHYEKNVILIEKNPDVAAVWRYLINATEADILALPLLENSEQRVSELDICPAAKLLIGFNIHSGDAKPRDTVSNHCRDYRPPWRHLSYRDPKTGWQRPAKEGEPGEWRDGYENFWGAKRRARIARQVEMIKHWTVLCGDYSDAPDIKATWHIDPPYEKAGKAYPCNTLDREHLAKWCRSRKGQVMVCEAEGATWMDFKPFAEIKSTPGKKRAGTSKEVVWFNG